MLEFIIISWVLVDIFLSHKPKYVFDKPWFGPNKCLSSVILFLPLVVLSWIIPIEKINLPKSKSSRLNWTDFRW